MEGRRQRSHRLSRLLVVVLLALGSTVGFAAQADAATGTFTVVGGHTRWSFDTGKPISITGSTTTAQGVATLFLDGASVTTAAEQSDNTFALTFTLPDTTCADGVANTHTVQVGFGAGGTDRLPSQQLLYRCATYTPVVTFDRIQNDYEADVDFGVYSSSPAVFVCIQAYDPSTTSYLGQVLETGAPPAALTVRATYTVYPQNQPPTTTVETLAWAGAAYQTNAAPGCYYYLHTTAITNVRATVSLSANYQGANVTGPTVRIIQSRILDTPDCVAPNSPWAVGGRREGYDNHVELTFATTQYSGPTTTTTQDTQSDDDGNFTVPQTSPNFRGTIVVTQKDIPIGGGAPVDKGGLSATVFVSVTCGSSDPPTPTVVATPPSFAQVDPAPPPGDTTPAYRIVRLDISNFSPDLTTTFNYPVYDSNGAPIAAPVTDAAGRLTVYAHVTPVKAPCTGVNFVVVTQPSLDPDGGTGPNATIPLEVSCPTVNNPALLYPGVTGDRTFTNLSQFDAAVPVTVNFQDPTPAGYAPVPGTSAQVVTTTTSGFAQAFIPTANIDCGGLHYLTATQAIRGAAYSSPPVARVPVVAVCSGDPVLTVTPASYAYSSGTRTITLHGTGFRPHSTQRLTLDGGAVTPATVPVNGAGVLDTAVPATNLACGAHELDAVNASAAGDDLKAVGVFTVTCPVATMNPDVIDGDDLPVTVTVNGSGFDPDSAVTITLPDGSTATSPTDGQGRIATPAAYPNPETLGVSLPSGQLACGPGVATVAETDQDVNPEPAAAAAYVVNCPRPASLTVTPSTIATTPGDRTVLVSGTGWRPGTILPVDIDGALVVDAAVNAGGGFDADVTLHAPAAGTHTVTAVQPRFRSASALLTVTTPALTVAPSSFSRDDPPATVTVTGSGYDPSFPVSVAVPGEGTRAVTADLNGGYTLTVPALGLPCGAGQQIIGTETTFPGAPFTIAPSASGLLSVACPDTPTITPTPRTYAFTPSGHHVVFTGVGFRPTTPVTVTGDGVPGTVVTTDPTGGFVLPLQLTGACGSHVVTARPTVGYAASTVYTVTCPALRSTPQDLDGLHLPHTVTIDGSGYDGGSVVALVLQQTGQPAVSKSVHADADGAFRTTLPALELFCGTAPITGIETGVPVIAPTASVVDTVHCRPAELDVSPKVINDGSVGAVTGRYFHPGETVTLVWQLADGTPGQGSCSARVQPDTTITTSCLVFGHDTLGNRELVATDERATGATAPALIVANPVQPGRRSLLPNRHLLARR